MSEIPESIKRTVLDIYADHWERDGLMGEAEELRRLGVAEAMRNMDENGWFDLIARALMAEREACAKIFDDEADEMRKRHDLMVDDGIGYASIYRREAEINRKTAERIRNR